MPNCGISRHANVQSLDLSLSLLNALGVKSPTRKQEQLMENLSANIVVRRNLIFSDTLSPQEVNCLYWTAKGMSTKEVARILDISIDTVKTYKKRIAVKLSVRNMCHAVFEGMRFGGLVK